MQNQPQIRPNYQQPQYVQQPPPMYYPPQPPQGRPTKDMVSNARHKEALKIVPKKSGNSWGSMMLRPNLTFANQDAGERVYVLIRAHWVTNLGWIVRNIIYFLLPWIIFGVVVNFQIDVSFISLRAFILLILIYYSIIITNVIKL